MYKRNNPDFVIANLVHQTIPTHEQFARGWGADLRYLPAAIPKRRAAASSVKSGLEKFNGSGHRLVKSG